MLDAVLPDAYTPFLVKKHILFPVGIEFLRMRWPEKGDNLWKREPERVAKSLSRQAKICARELLSSINYKGNNDTARCLRKCIWEAATVVPHVFYNDGNGEEFIFALGYDLRNHIIKADNEIAVVPGSTLAFPHDEKGMACLPILKTRRLGVSRELGGAPLRTLEPLPYQSY
jgi:hypothetical protein